MFQQKIRQYIEKTGLFAEGGRLLVALSGGADSVALLRVLLALGYRCEAAHCNFHLRGEESDRDERFVRALCTRLEVPLHVAHFDTEAYARRQRISIEMAARELRYAYFDTLLQERNIGTVAVAHHRNDSVETFMLNLVRGTGINGLCGICPRNGRVARPLLGVSRREILDYLQAIGQEYVTDSTNLQDDYTRNKIRLDVLPLLETLNPSVQESIAATAERLSEVAGLYNRLMEEGKARVTTPFPAGGEGAFRVEIAALLAEPMPRSLLFELVRPLGFNSSQADSLYAMLQGESGRRMVANEWSVWKDRTALLAVRDEALLSEDEYRLPADGELALPDGRRIVAGLQSRTPDFLVPRQKNLVALDADALSFPLTVRRWRQGDRFVPFGMTGMKLLSDYMTDRKFPLWQKQRQWVVCSGDAIAWLAGERCDNRFRITDATSRVLCLELC